MDKKKITKWIIFWILIVIVVALLSWWLAENNFPSAIDKGTWLSFFGGYFGSAMGAIATIIGVYLTFQYQKEYDEKKNEIKEKEYLEQLQEEKNKEVLPYFLIKRFENCRNGNFQELIPFSPMIYLNHDTKGEKIHESIYFKNIGKGPALAIKVQTVHNNKFWNLQDMDVVEVGESFMCDFIHIVDLPDEINSSEIEDIVGSKQYEVLIEFKNIYGKEYLYRLFFKVDTTIDMINQKYQCEFFMEKWEME